MWKLSEHQNFIHAFHMAFDVIMLQQARILTYEDIEESSQSELSDIVEEEEDEIGSSERSKSGPRHSGRSQHSAEKRRSKSPTAKTKTTTSQVPTRENPQGQPRSGSNSQGQPKSGSNPQSQPRSGSNSRPSSHSNR